VPAHLHRCGRHAGRIGHQRQVADHQHLGVSAEREVGLDGHAPPAAELRGEERRERRRAHAGGPHDGARLDAIRVQLHARGVDAGDRRVQVDGRPEPLEIALRAASEALG
jgi:hypothetical protein